MQLHDASSLPDSVVMRRLAVVIGLVTAIAFGGTVGVLLSKSTPATVAVPAEEPRDRELRFARWELDMYVGHAFSLWRHLQPQRTCPRDLLELNRHAPYLHAVDPWGAPYQLACERGGIVVRTAGLDGALGTTDDLVARSRTGR